MYQKKLKYKIFLNEYICGGEGGGDRVKRRGEENERGDRMSSKGEGSNTTSNTSQVSWIIQCGGKEGKIDKHTGSGMEGDESE